MNSQAGKAAHVCNGSTWEVRPERAGIKGYVWLHSESEPNLDYTRPFPKTKQFATGGMSG